MSLILVLPLSYSDATTFQWPTNISVFNLVKEKKEKRNQEHQNYKILLNCNFMIRYSNDQAYILIICMKLWFFHVWKIAAKLVSNGNKQKKKKSHIQWWIKYESIFLFFLCVCGYRKLTKLRFAELYTKSNYYYYWYWYHYYFFLFSDSYLDEKEREQSKVLTLWMSVLRDQGIGNSRMFYFSILY